MQCAVHRRLGFAIVRGVCPSPKTTTAVPTPSKSLEDNQKAIGGFRRNAVIPDKAVRHRHGGRSGVEVETIPSY